jgi:hypothetical protein
MTKHVSNLDRLAELAGVSLPHSIAPVPPVVRAGAQEPPVAVKPRAPRKPSARQQVIAYLRGRKELPEVSEAAARLGREQILAILGDLITKASAARGFDPHRGLQECARARRAGWYSIDMTSVALFHQIAGTHGVQAMIGYVRPEDTGLGRAEVIRWALDAGDVALAYWWWTFTHMRDSETLPAALVRDLVVNLGRKELIGNHRRLVPSDAVDLILTENPESIPVLLRLAALSREQEHRAAQACSPRDLHDVARYLVTVGHHLVSPETVRLVMDRSVAEQVPVSADIRFMHLAQTPVDVSELRRYLDQPLVTRFSRSEWNTWINGGFEPNQPTTQALESLNLTADEKTWLLYDLTSGFHYWRRSVFEQKTALIRWLLEQHDPAAVSSLRGMPFFLLQLADTSKDEINDDVAAICSILMATAATAFGDDKRLWKAFRTPSRLFLDGVPSFDTAVAALRDRWQQAAGRKAARPAA